MRETEYLSIYFFLFSYFLFFIIYFIYFFECLGIRFFSSLTCDLRDTMPRQGSLTLLPREAEDFPGGSSRSGHMPPLTYLARLQPIYYNSWFIFIHINITKVLLVVKTLIKKFFFQVQFLRIKLLNRSATMKT